MELIIIGAVMNFYAWTNIDFFVTSKLNDTKYKCEWVDKGWGKAKKGNPNLSFFGYTKWIQSCVEKDNK
tara:strand:- start:369 stop:575 length:207 start_codon:yes stop_codon:yes gene_type:complete